jgi:predicted  nucleic acid-binding Zn-ribbon protein
MVDSPEDELEKLQKLRTELESRLAEIDEKRETEEENVKVLREKVAIRELEEKISAKQDSLAGLRIEKNELEDKLKAPNKNEPEDALKPSNKISMY